MKARTVLAIILVSAAGIFLASQAVSQETGSPNQEELMAAWAKYAQPGEHHKFLEPFVGSWDFQTKWWMEPGAEPQESRGTSECEWIMGGRFLMTNVFGEMSGESFHGISILGYDNFRQEYVLFWIDEMTTAFMLSTGKSDESGKVFTFEGTYDDLMTGEKDKKSKAIFRILSEDQNVYETYEAAPDGSEFKSFEVTYTRKK
jgi:hypothetical protein